jgi:hypothetical protein
MPCRADYRAARDTVPCGIPCRPGYHAVRDTVPCVIPCRVGYRAAWDTVPRGTHAVRDAMPCGIPCRAGYRAAWDAMPCGLPCRNSGAYLYSHDSRDVLGAKFAPNLIGAHAVNSTAQRSICGGAVLLSFMPKGFGVGLRD